MTTQKSQTADATMYPSETVRILHRYKEIIKTHNKRVIGYVGKQEQLLKKFRETEYFFEAICQSKSTIYFKISLYEFLKKYPALKKCTLSSNYFEKNFKIMTVSKQNVILLEQTKRPIMILCVTFVFDFSVPARIFILFYIVTRILLWNVFACCENFYCSDNFLSLKEKYLEKSYVACAQYCEQFRV